jgi:maltokinase
VTLPFLDWLPKQRWYAGRTRTLAQTELIQVTALAENLELMFVRAHYTDGGSDVYQVAVAWDDPPEPEFTGIATIGDSDGRIGYDALYTDRAARTLLRLIQAGEQVGEVSFHRGKDATLPVDTPSRVAEGEQSNTSVIFDSSAVLKLFRRVVPGMNPELELGQVLSEAGSPYVPQVLGSIQGVDPSGEPLVLAMVTQFAANSAVGWQMALASVRDLYAEADLHPDEVGGDFAAESFRIGETVAAVHATLAAELGAQPGRVPVPEMIGRLGEAAGLVAEVAAFSPELHRIFADAQQEVTVQRVHGDLHLGQMLRTPYQWLLIDFEGEPGQSSADRRRPDSPLRDVAGVLRSFDYAGHQLLVDEPPDSQLFYRAAEWSRRNREAFCDGYASVAGFDPREHETVLRAYELDKAVYEAAYEAKHRPGWLWIPLRSIERMLGVEQR